MHIHPRPPTPTVHAARVNEPGPCPECGAEVLSAYRVMSEGGWWHVVKCGQCLSSVRREPAPMFGAYVPLGAPR
ncbi:MAG TPA: hypothetical protein PKA84_04555 [Rubrivivax sp.]|nr:hypothetical protein [Rubrivivax sp.]